MGKTRKHTAAAKRRKQFNQKVRRKLFVQARNSEEESLQVDYDDTCIKEINSQ